MTEPTVIIAKTRARDCFEQAIAEFRAGRPERAADLCRAGLDAYPEDANLLCLSAKISVVLRNFPDARHKLDDAIRLYPEFAVAHDVYGDVLLAEGFPATAVKAYEQALRLDPARVAVFAKIEKAEALQAAAPEPEVVEDEAGASRRMAFANEIHEAERFLKSGEPQKAESIFRRILERDPDHVEAARLLAGIASDRKRYRDAEVFLRRAVKNAPDYGRALVDLTNVLRELDKLDEALDVAMRVVNLAPGKPEPHVLHAGILAALGRHRESIDAYERALELSPGMASAMCAIAHHLKTVGQQDEAIAMYRKAIATTPGHAESYWSLANLKTFQFEPKEIAAMQALLDDGETPDESRVQIHNALGLDFESRGDYDTAFAHYAKCNAIRRDAESYDPVETEVAADRVVEIFDKAFIDEREGAGIGDPAPIFIVGLPRSGSTLIEQILASHSLVDGTHELGDLARVVQRACREHGQRQAYPDAVTEFAPGDWRAAGEAYLGSTARFRSGAPHFIDKNPNNFMYIGFLRLALPGAKIIDARRHPLDSCFGSYKQLFASGQPFSYDLAEIGEYYLQYRRQLDHWHRVLPGFVLDVHYERVVADLDAEVRRILEFCGLPFEEGCLRFYETERAVKTASSEQVRRPIYKSSVNLWQRYENYLGELVDVLEPVLHELPAADRPARL